MIAEFDWKDRFYKYVDDVLTGRRVVGQKVKDACRRHVEDEEKSRNDPDYPYEFHMRSASFACQFVSMLTISGGDLDGERFDVYPFQIFIIGSIFGWKRRDKSKPPTEWTRRFKDAWVSLGRGNGKSPIAAAIGLYVFAFDDPKPDGRAQVHAVATKRDQAKIVFDDARSFVDRSPALQKHIARWKFALTIESNGGEFKAMASESKGMDGLRPNVILLDELHAWREQHRETLEKIRTALAKKSQSLCLITTTAGNEDSEIWLEETTFAEGVVSRDSPVEADSLFVFIADIDDEDEPLDESCWIKANPMLEHGIVKIDALREMAAKAEHVPRMRNEFKRYHCNRLTYSASRAITPEQWANGAAPIPWDLVEDAEAYVGFDWGQRDDLTALAIVWRLPNPDDRFAERYAIHAKCWTPEDGARNLLREPWCDWVRDGHLGATVGNSTDPQPVWQQLLDWEEKYWIKSVAADRVGGREFLTRVENERGIEVYDFPQTHAKYHEPVLELEKALEEGRIMHGNNPLLAWCAGNLVLKEDNAGYVMPAKRKSRDKIDPIAAVLMALSEAMYAQRALRSSYYDDEDAQHVF